MKFSAELVNSGGKQGIHLRLFVLQRNIASEDEGIGQAFLHVRVASTVVENEALHQFGVVHRFMLHLLDLHHEQVNGLALSSNALNGVDANVREAFRQLGSHLRLQSSPGNAEQQTAVHRLWLVLELVEELNGLLSGQVITVGNDTRVNALLDEILRLLEQFADNQHRRSGSITSLVILGRGCLGNQRCRWVRDLL